MINAPAIGFVALLGVVGLGVDYHQQGQRAGLGLGQMGVSAYADTITARYGEAQQVRADAKFAAERNERQRAGARVFLPEAPDGWARRAWLDGDNTSIKMPPRVLSQAEQEALDVSPMLAKMAEKSALKAEERLDAESWVYQHGHDLVMVRAMFRPGAQGKTMTSAMGTMLGSGGGQFSALDGWAIIGGMAFGEHIPDNPGNMRPYQVFRAAIGFGDEVRLEVRSDAPEAAVREILAGIDYDGLNSLLARPLMHVGANAPTVPLVDQPEIAGRILRVQEDISAKRRDAAEDWLAAGTTPQDIMTMSLRQMGYDVVGSLGEQDAAYDRTMQELNDLTQDNATMAKPKKHAKSGGFMKKLGGMLKSDETALGGHAAPSQVKVRRLDAGGSGVATCNSQGAFKSCRVGG